MDNKIYFGTYFNCIIIDNKNKIKNNNNVVVKEIKNNND